MHSLLSGNRRMKTKFPLNRGIFMAVDLYDHQRKAVDKLVPGSILCGGVGSGKSRTALAYFYEKECKGTLSGYGESTYPTMKSPKDLYIITTAKKRDSLEWEEELIPFMLSTKDENDICKVVVDSWNNIKKYVDVRGAFFIFDEQRVVGSGAWVRSFLKIAKCNNWILLSATPGDTWMDYIPVFIANGFYKNKTQFLKRHVVFSPHVDFPKVERYLEEDLLRETKDFITIPMKFDRSTTRHHEWCKLDYDQEKYDTVWTKRWDIFKNEPIKNHPAACYLIRRVVNSDPSRLEAVAKIKKKHERLIIFYNFNYELDSLLEFLVEHKIPHAQWNGHKHEPIPDTNEWVYLVQYNSGSEGWNCVSTNAIIFYSQNYSYRMITQAAGRIDRINTKYVNLYYYHLYSNSPIDKAIKRAYEAKKDFNQKKFGQV